MKKKSGTVSLVVPKSKGYAPKLVLSKAKQQKKQKIPINIFGNQNGKMVKMTYVVNPSITLSGALNANTFTSQLSFRLNNVNLPYIGQVAGSPLPQGYTQAATAFTRFKVYGAKIKAEFYDPSEDLQVGMLTVSSNDTQDLQLVAVPTSDQKRGCLVKNLSQSGSRKVTMHRYVKISAQEGLSKDQFQGDFTVYSQDFNNSVATAGTNEAGTTGELVKKRVPKVHFAVAANTAIGAGDTARCKARFTIVYYVYCYGKATLPLGTSSA